MERYKAPSKFLQYQLWSECTNGCKFCLCRDQIPIDKKFALQFILKKLDEDEVKEFDEVGLIGGEIFDGPLDDPEVNELFYKVLRKICCMHFKKIYIATNLIYDIYKHLVPCLEFLKKMQVAEKVLICTSYDTKWRFDGYKCGLPKKHLFKNNMRWLHQYYPEFNTHIEIILTGDFIDKVLNGDFDISYFSNYYKSRVDYIEPTSGWYYNNKEQLQEVCPNFFPTKEKFIKFLKQECIEKKNVDISCLISNEIRSSRRYQIDCGQFVCQKDRRIEGFQTVCLDPSKKFETGFIDTDESIESVCIALCELMDE
jgi:hypothetical protein